MSFATETHVTVLEPDALFEALGSHLSQHGTLRSRSLEGDCFDFDHGTAFLKKRAGGIHIHAAARSEAELFYLRMMLATHVLEFSASEPRLVWTGHGADAALPPNFRLMTVQAVKSIAPHMRRLTLKGEDLAWFDSRDLHVRLLIPPKGAEPEWPRLAESGLIIWPEGDNKPYVRKYTIRRIDVGSGQVDVDFVTHEDAGPGSDFAAAARPGDVVGMAGPGGGGHRLADWNLLAGDETALPAIARILEAMPADARGTAFIEVADRSEEQSFRVPHGMDLHWLHRNGAAPGTTSLLLDAIRAIEWPQTEKFAWVACEFQAFREVRSYLRKEVKLGRDEHLVVAYWRRGVDEDGFAATKHHGD